MKKSRMLLLFGGLFLMLVGYVAWCWRTFYLRAPMPDLSSMPEEAQAAATTEIERWKLRNPEEFNGGRMKELLMNPYESDLPPIEVKRNWDEFWSFRRRGIRSGFDLVHLRDGWTSAPEKRKTY